ncbi:transcription intermediary factor 1-beta-like [Saccostrea cucullata]|uniref:transcription intermediary factor 1-beta-like n=1 Tax=Saccostrea cuccullata TaxID=36930 RepID=UPI002ED0487D
MAHVENSNKKSCDICQRMNSVELATSRCIDCCDDLCEKCANCHHANRLSMEHRVLSLDDAETADCCSNMTFFCEKHADRKLEVYCFDHEQACCLMCATTEHRKCEKVENLEECAKQASDSNEVKKLRELLENLKGECTDDTANITKSKEKFHVQVNDVRSHIRSIKQSMVEFLNEKEAEFIEQLERVERDKNTQFVDKIEMLSDFQVYLDNDIEKLKNPNDKNKISLFLAMKEIQKNYKSLKENLGAVQSSYKSVDIKLEDDAILTKVLQEPKPFGELVVEETDTNSKTDYLNSTLVLESVLVKSGCRLTDVEAIRDDHVLAICDNHNLLDLFHINECHVASSKLSGKPWAMTKTGELSVAVTIRSPRSSIEFVDLAMDKSPFLTTTKILNLSFKPNGIACDNGTLIVSSTDGLLRHIDDNGTILHTVTVKKGYVYGLCLYSRRIIYSHHIENGKVYVLHDDKLGTQEFTFEHEHLSYPLGVSCDPDGNIYIVGCSTNNVLQMNMNGEFVRQILSKDKDKAIDNPMAVRVAVMGSRPRLLLTCQNEVRLYNFESCGSKSQTEEK